MRYIVKLTPHAIDQIRETILYIAQVLLVPETANSWSDYLEKAVSGLGTMPERYPMVEEEPWKSRGYRKMPVHNFIVYYFIDEKQKTVWVTAVVYGRRDQMAALHEVP